MLSVLVWLPLVVAVGIALAPRSLSRLLGMGVAVATLVVAGEDLHQVPGVLERHGGRGAHRDERVVDVAEARDFLERQAMQQRGLAEQSARPQQATCGRGFELVTRRAQEKTHLAR